MTATLQASTSMLRRTTPAHANGRTPFAIPAGPAVEDPLVQGTGTTDVLARRRRWVTLGLLVSAQFVVMLDTSIVNVALPSIQADLRLSPTGVTCVVNAYLLAFGGLLLLSGRAADLFGRRRIFVAGSTVFTVGTMVAALAATQELLVAGRIVQGAGAAALSPAAMSLLLLTFPGPERAKAMSIWGAASALGGATGVMVGGLLVGCLGWSSVFFVTVPISAGAVVMARTTLNEGAWGERRRFDGLGATVITGAVIALIYGALGGADHGWTSFAVVASLTGSAMLMAGFVIVERRTADPLVPLELFRSRTLTTGVALAVLGGGARASTFVLLALYLQQALAMTPQQAGLAMVPTSLTGFVVSVALLPRMLRALGPQRSLVIGVVVLACGHLWLAHAPLPAGYPVAVLPGLLLIATGVELSFTPTTMVIASAVPESHAGLASGLAGSDRRSARHRHLYSDQHLRSSARRGPARRNRILGGLHRSSGGRTCDGRSGVHDRASATMRAPPPTALAPGSISFVLFYGL